MKVAVLIKQVPDTTAKVGITSGSVDEGAISKWSISPYDEYALESALSLQSGSQGTGIIFTSSVSNCCNMVYVYTKSNFAHLRFLLPGFTASIEANDLGKLSFA